MKKLLLALVALGTSAVVYAGNAEEAGNVTDPANKAQFITVINADAVAHPVGSIVVWKDGTYDGVEVATTTTANSKLIAGIVAGAALPASGIGRIQISGYHSAILISTANSAGDCLGTSTTAEKTAVTTTVGACLAVALEATTSSTTVKGLIKGM